MLTHTRHNSKICRRKFINMYKHLFYLIIFGHYFLLFFFYCFHTIMSNINVLKTKSRSHGTSSVCFFYHVCILVLKNIESFAVAPVPVEHNSCLFAHFQFASKLSLGSVVALASTCIISFDLYT